jgi:Arc/MetJ-type ribon-helix-helix transcriptional regulator
MAWKRTEEQRTVFVTVRFSPSEAADIDFLVGQMNAQGRSEAVRAAVRQTVKRERRRAEKAANS